MAVNHEDAAAELHATFEQRNGSIGNRRSVDMTGAKLPIVESEKNGIADIENDHFQSPNEAEPTEHEKQILRRIGDKFPASAYLIAAVELCERFTCKLVSTYIQALFTDLNA